MKAQEYRGLEEAALRAQVEKTRKELLDLRCQVSLGEEVRPHQVAELRRDIARMQTVLRERELEAARLASTDGGSA